MALAPAPARNQREYRPRHQLPQQQRRIRRTPAGPEKTRQWLTARVTLQVGIAAMSAAIVVVLFLASAALASKI